MLLSCIAYAVIPVYTLLFVSGTNWFTSNLSVIGSLPTRRAAFFLLGVIIGLYYYEALKKLLVYLPHPILEHRLLVTALLLLLLAVTTPYLPESVPLQAFLHVVFAFVSSVLLALCLYLILWRLSALSPDARQFLRPFRLSMVAAYQGDGHHGGGLPAVGPAHSLVHPSVPPFPSCSRHQAAISRPVANHTSGFSFM